MNKNSSNGVIRPKTSDRLLPPLGDAHISIEESAVAVIGGICVSDKRTNRAKILAYEDVAKKLPQIDIPVNHYIHGGMYGREITIPKGSVITGQIYKFDHFDIMISGDITVSTDSGEAKRLTGFNVFNGLSGKKRAGFAHEDTHWITFHAFDGDDGEQIQKDITADSFSDLSRFHTDVNISDYINFVNESGMTELQILEQVNNELDMDKSEIYGMFVKESKIQGLGLFASKRFASGGRMGPARVGGFRTLAGRYSNHAYFSNAEIRVKDGDAYIYATRDIFSGDEITVNYREVMKERLKEGDL